MGNVQKNMVLSWEMLKKTWYYHGGKGILMVHAQKQSINQINCNVQNHVLSWEMSVKHGITMVNVYETWYYHGKYLNNKVFQLYASKNILILLHVQNILACETFKNIVFPL